MSITIRALRYFLAAIERGSIAGAAEAMAVAPSAIGAAIDGIEATLDLTLVNRRRARGLEPTPGGIAFARRAALLVEEHENLLSFGAELQGGFAGSLRIGYYAPVAPAFLPAILAPLLAGHPGLSVDLVECDTDAARGGAAERAIRRDPVSRGRGAGGDRHRAAGRGAALSACAARRCNGGGRVDSAIGLGRATARDARSAGGPRLLRCPVRAGGHRSAHRGHGHDP